DELERIRQRKLMEMKQRALEQQNQEQAIREQMEAQKRALLMRILSPEARQRLTNIKLSRPQFADAIESQIIQLAQMGHLSRLGIELPISDEQFKKILIQITNRQKKREFKIKKI
ncbi:MAG: DNA-binding protein, partial [Promethearchaeota archaeon]